MNKSRTCWQHSSLHDDVTYRGHNFVVPRDQLQSCIGATLNILLRKVATKVGVTEDQGAQTKTKAKRQ